MSKSKFSSLGAATQEALLAWFNIVNPSPVDKLRLAELALAGKFRHWDCPGCREPVYVGEPDDWAHFQGVLQADYVSYPGGAGAGTEACLALCDTCRHGAGTAEDLEIPAGFYTPAK